MRQQHQRQPRSTSPGLALSEDDLLVWVLGTAKLHGWLAWHPRPARTKDGWRTAGQGDAGLPDLVLARLGKILLAELKSATGTATPEQKKWLAAAAPNARLWRPADRPAILAELSARP